MSNLAAIFGAGFDTNSVEPQGDFDLISPGKVPVVIDKSEVRQTKKGDGYYLELTMTITDGEYRNRKLWDKIHIQNPSQECVKWGLRKLSALGKATGVTYVSNENQFLGKTCMVHVTVKDEQNEIRTYSAMTGPTAAEPVTPLQNYTQKDYAPPTQQYEQAAGRVERQSVVPMQMQPPMQPPTVHSPVAPQGAAVGPIGQPTTGKAPWER